MTPSSRARPDFTLLMLTFILVGFGLLMVFSSSAASASGRYQNLWYFTERQLLWSAAGTAAMLVLMNISYMRFYRWYRHLFILTLLLLVLVLLVGTKVNGHRSWFGVGSFGIQPTELAKLGLIMYLAALLSKKGDRIEQFKTGLLPMLVIIGLITGLIMLQPDIGSDIVIALAAVIVVIAGGANLFQLIAVGIGVSPIVLGIVLTKSYRMLRFTSYLNPWNDTQNSSYQLVQSLYALGHGGIAGVGFGKGFEKMYYLPEAHTDFIFSTIGEEFGFIGSVIFLLLYALLIWRGLIIAVKCPDPFGSYLGIGIISIIGIQALVNLGGVTGSIPITGVPLPLISYGGSSLLISMASLGILLSISREGRSRHDSRRVPANEKA